MRAFCRNRAPQEAVVRRLAADPHDVVRRRGVHLGTVAAGEHERPDRQIGGALEVAEVGRDRVVERIGHVDQANLAGRGSTFPPV